MSDRELLPADPATLAGQEALDAFHKPAGFTGSTKESSTLKRLDSLAAEFSFTNTAYWVNANRGLSIPVSFEAHEEVSIINFFKMAFEGTFKCYAKVAIGRIIGVENGSVDALCLTFDKATVLPYIEQLPEQHLLYVPVLAVDKIDPISVAA